MIEAFREILFAEFFDQGRIRKIRLGNESLEGWKIFFFLPMHGDLRFGEFLLGPSILSL